MSVDLINFERNLYVKLAKMFLMSSGTGGDDSPLFIGYEPIGLPLPVRLFRLNQGESLSPDLAREKLSDLANERREVRSGIYQLTGRSITSTYKLLLQAMFPLPGVSPEQSTLIARIHQEANQLFLSTVRSYISPEHDPFSTYHPVIAAPPDWFDPTMDDNWQRVVISDTDLPTPAEVIQSRFLSIPSSENIHNRDSNLQEWKWGLVQSEEQPTGDQSTISLPITSLNLDFELCFVSLRYEWLNWSLFDLSGWFAAGFKAHAKEINLPSIPVAALLVRKISLTAILDNTTTVHSTEELENLTALGPFRFDQNQSHVSTGVAGGFIVTKGYEDLQLIGWIGQVLSSIPPESDPALATQPISENDQIQELHRHNIDFSVPESDLREWLNNPTDTPYPAISKALLNLLGSKNLRRPVFLDVIVFNYEHSPSVSSPREVDNVDLTLLKASVLKGYNERYEEPVNDFESLLQ
jgi:hypothetical protein